MGALHKITHRVGSDAELRSVASLIFFQGAEFGFPEIRGPFFGSTQTFRILVLVLWGVHSGLPFGKLHCQNWS